MYAMYCREALSFIDNEASVKVCFVCECMLKNIYVTVIVEPRKALPLR